ncbi:protein-export membrane protein SecF [Candidatus Uhrbacteria bacterium RIFCSPLOWO2_02_FULL_49_11]|uniref:Protein-export membrane protein SecF n=1 Tax=Candidatus Uhrbacteria bacterium RIFCSPLOWO2_02_FULL_49_11 TaxID=1802409 RepID=A0A1F7VDJ7_9BACT|nr:MAG: protein-export membrane protein SecF [Candidatus Uhrbacteria bacterium RIFCSPLOWO2_02_FULL_49_11]
MLAIIPNRKYNLGFSALLILLSATALFVWGLKFGIDFTGGAMVELESTLINPPASSEIQQKLISDGFDVASIQMSNQNTYLVRLGIMDEGEHQRFTKSIEENFKTLQKNEGSNNAFIEKRFESIGPTISQEFRQKSYLAIIIALLAIIAYIGYSFRKVSKPVASWKYGICAVIALIHDVTIPTGIFAVLGRYAGWEVDLLFVTALLTVLGFSVHDTIVVYDRIRENLLKSGGRNFAEIANISVNQTLARSINTSLTTVIVLVALFVLGGETTRRFIFVLIAGIIFGTYSSIFIASPLLVIWNNISQKNKK